MGKDELFRLLDLGGADAAPATGGPALEITPVEGTESAGPTALELDEWALRRGRDLLAESQRLQALPVDEFAAADFHAAAFEPDPVLKRTCADPLRHQFLTQLLETADYRQLHLATALDETASSIAAAAFAVQFAELRREEDAKPRDESGREMAALRTAGQALKAAREEVAEAADIAAACGLGPGCPGSNDPKAIAALFRRVRSDRQLRRICELAGRFRRVAQSRQRNKAVHGPDDVVGVTLGGELGRLLPAELARLACDELYLDALRRLAERQAMCRDHRAVEPLGKGPILVVVDESGSMAGEKVETAKALALALAWVARRQRRWAALVAYSGDTGERLLPLPPGRWDESAVLDWLSAFLGGGSSLDVPLAELPDYYRQLAAPRGRTDVILLTDARCRIPAGVGAAFVAWKQEVQARVIGLVVRDAAGDLADVCDEVHTVPALSADGEAVGRVLSI